MLRSDRSRGDDKFRTARAFAPGHVSGLFAPAKSGTDPRSRGSVGAGLVLSLGVEATASWAPTGRRRVIVRDETHQRLPISDEVTRRLLGDRMGTISVRLHHELPIGQGFGMSAAGALATGLAVASVLGRSRQDAVETSHLADLFGGGGLGGVAAILGGGLELRHSPGVPPWGIVRHRPFPRFIFVGVTGPPIPSPRILGSPAEMKRIRAAWESSQPPLPANVTDERFLSAAEEFTDALRLAPPGLRRLIDELRAAGGRVAQAMFGNSFFAVAPPGTKRDQFLSILQDRKVPAVEVPAARRGAHLLRLRSDAARARVLNGARVARRS